jgi:GDP-D-mannose 3',5'-epimerase
LGRHVLVTGGAGMIGSNLVKRLAAMGCRVSVADNLWRGRLENLEDEAGRPVIDLERDFHQVDLSVPGACEPLLDGVDYVFHLADVVAGIDYVFRNQGHLFRHNLLINSNVIAAVRQRPVKGLIYAGTACSFPAEKQTGTDAPPLREEDMYPASPESAYGWSKLMGQYEAQLLESEAGVPTCVPVFHNIYGAPTDFEEPRAQVIPSLIRKAIRHPEEEFVVWGSGAQGRAFLHVDDAVDALVACMERGLGHGLVQIGPDVCTSIREVAEAVLEIADRGIPLRFDLSRPEGDRGRRADYRKAQRVLGWEPRVSLRDGLRGLYAWIEQRLRLRAR